ncbi:sulfite exporter TauE/SafE family protein [Pseudoxanthomonas sp. JBR18]|uniref:sulfite exporter TauE/SafE family protein n=1 Tax=Pseudoxanthomonas sp. JBR18 TaxID=2969308 RepID=UPI002306B8F3|nr:sulfite exporter TauE/SafE family protein [Pseudoxanthomonas sp. JBR18]WCE02705.1 sulfite exporter TauE/SafE family protein [Pseudoxanthomonas sp. JBR18]
MPHDPLSLLLVCAVLVLAGWVKGVAGMGLPAVGMAALGLMMSPVQAATLMVVPLVLTNVWQAFSGPALGALVRRLAWMLVGIVAGTCAGIGLLTARGSPWPGFALGLALAAYGVVGLWLPPLSLPQRAARWAAPVVGACTGVLCGATGVFSVPLVPYLTALGLGRDALIQAMGLSFLVCSATLGAALAVRGHYPGGVAWQSCLAVLPALAGVALGQRTRQRMDPARFRFWFFVSLVLVGGFMAVRALV